jgi:type I restriction enzyme M protein
MSLSDDELKKYWNSACLLWKHMDAAEYKHIVLGLVFLKYISDSFELRRAELQEAFENPDSEQFKKDERRRLQALEDRNYYSAVNVFWVPDGARWSDIGSNARQPDIAQRIDEALFLIEKENPRLLGILERKYSESKIPVSALGGVVDLIGTINYGKSRAESTDVLGEVYEYFLGNFASAEGKLGGQFYTSPSIVRTLVEVLEPLEGRVYDPCCGSGGMFVQSEKFVEAHGGALGSIAIYGQESNPTTRRLAAMNLAIRGMEFDLGKIADDTFENDQHRDRKFDFILMNPPFGNDASYPRNELLDDVRWKRYGVPRSKPANYAWMSHAIHHLAPKGRAGIVMARGSLTSANKDDVSLRRAFLDDDVIECIIDLPANLFFNTPIPSCIWFFNRDKSQWKNKREGEILLIDARRLGHPISRSQIAFSEAEIEKIGQTFREWTRGKYQDEEGFCASVTRSEISKNRDSLSPGRYLGLSEDEADELGVVEDVDELLARAISALEVNALTSAQVLEFISSLGRKNES